MNLEAQESAALLAKRHLYLCQRYVKETDSLQRLHWELEIKKAEEKLRSCTRSEATMALLTILQPFVVQATASLTERHAALLTWRFLESLYQPPKLSPSNIKAEPEPLPDDLEGLINVLRELREERRRQAMANILAYGKAAIPELEAALSRHSSPLMQARILYILAILGEVRLMPLIWQAQKESLTSEISELLEQSLLRMSQTLEQAPEKLPLNQLIEIFGGSQTAMPPLADSLARALMQLATTAPTLELRAALTHLQGSWLRPLSSTQREARKAIEEATRNVAYLPLPTNTPITNSDLPRPAEQETSAHSLPRPTVEDRTGGG